MQGVHRLVTEIGAASEAGSHRRRIRKAVSPISFIVMDIARFACEPRSFVKNTDDPYLLRSFGSYSHIV